MSNSMGDVLGKLKAKRRLYIQLTFGLIFLSLVGLYTFSHNANLSLQGTSQRFQLVGLIAAAVGECFVLYAFVVGMFSTGAQKIAALLSDLAMLAVLLLNTIVDYANVSGKVPQSGQWILELYGTFGAPILIVVVLVAGLHFILYTDHAVQHHSAEISAGIAEREIETAAIYTARDEMVAEMNNAAHTDRVRRAAQDKVTSIIDRIAAKKRE